MVIASGGGVVRATRQLAAVAALRDEVAGFHPAQDVHGLLRARGDRVGLTTVYRSLQLLADADEVDVLRLASGEVAYRRCSEHHHHHLVCRSCGATVEVAGPAVEHWAQRVATEHGYRDVSHTVEVFGVCPQCTADAQRTADH